MEPRASDKQWLRFQHERHPRQGIEQRHHQVGLIHFKQGWNSPILRPTVEDPSPVLRNIHQELPKHKRPNSDNPQNRLSLNRKRMDLDHVDLDLSLKLTRRDNFEDENHNRQQKSDEDIDRSCLSLSFHQAPSSKLLSLMAKDRDDDHSGSNKPEYERGTSTLDLTF